MTPLRLLGIAFLITGIATGIYGASNDVESNDVESNDESIAAQVQSKSEDAKDKIQNLIRRENTDTPEIESDIAQINHIIDVAHETRENLKNERESKTDRFYLFSGILVILGLILTAIPTPKK